MKRAILITGGAGFIGSHVVRLFVNKYPDYQIVNLDKLTYAGNLANLHDIKDRPNYTFVKADICDFETVRRIIRQYEVDGIIHYCVANIPGAVPNTSTFALTNATLKYVIALADKGWQKACEEDAALKAGLNIVEGKVVYKAVADLLK